MTIQVEAKEDRDVQQVGDTTGQPNVATTVEGVTTPRAPARLNAYGDELTLVEELAQVADSTVCIETETTTLCRQDGKFFLWTETHYGAPTSESIYCLDEISTRAANRQLELFNFGRERPEIKARIAELDRKDGVTK